MPSGTTLQKAALYEKYRLPYPPQLVRDLLDRIGQVQTVADVGAGTGQLARLFADSCSTLYAIEPDPAMRQVASQALAEISTIKVLAGSAEQTTLAPNSLDLIVIGNAFQRFKPQACVELRRILKLSGHIAVISYTFTNPAFTDLLFSKLAALTSMTARIDTSWRRTPIEELFGTAQIHTRRYPQSHPQTWPAFFGAACSGLEAPEPTDPEFKQFEAINREVFDTLAVNGHIQMDYETQVSFGQPQGL